MRTVAKSALMLRRKSRFALKAGNHETILTSELYSGITGSELVFSTAAENPEGLACGAPNS
jgi:hypothetical protein